MNLRFAWRTLRIAALVPGSLLFAQAAVPWSGFGGDLQTLTLPHYAFLPHNSAQTYFSACCANDAYRHPTAGSNQFFAPLDSGRLPNGARVERIDVFVRDTDTALDAEIAAYLCRQWIQDDGSAFNGDCSL